MKFTVSGLTGTFASATLRPTTANVSGSQSNSGGTVSEVSDSNWTESGITFTNAPAIDGPALASLPSLCDDMHDCSISTGDTWMQNNLDGYAQWAKTHNSLLIVTFDEASSTSPNQIYTVFVGQHVKPGSYTEQINHYSVLRTVEDAYGLAALYNAASATPITDVWQ